MTTLSGVWRISVAYGARTSRGWPSGRQTAVGSSWRTSPVAGWRNFASAPGRKGAILLRSKLVTRGVSVSPGPTLCVNAGPAQTPENFGLPSGMRGIPRADCPAAGGISARTASNPIRRFLTWPLFLRARLGRIYGLFLPDQRIAPVGEGDNIARGVVRAILRAMTGDGEHLSQFEAIFRNAAPRQHARRGRREAPNRDLTAIVLHFQVEPDVGVGPFQTREGPRQFDRFLQIELGRIRMVRPGYRGQRRDAQHHGSRSHSW